VKNHSARRATSDRTRRAELTAKLFVHPPLGRVGLGLQPLARQPRPLPNKPPRRQENYIWSKNAALRKRGVNESA